MEYTQAGSTYSRFLIHDKPYLFCPPQKVFQAHEMPIHVIIHANHHAIVRKLHVLREAGYLDDQGLLARGRLASRINGYEIQIVELLFDGVLDEMDLDELNTTFTAIVYESRPGDTQLRQGLGTG